MKYLKTCAICGKQWEAGTVNALYCSDECRREAARAHEIRADRGYWHRYYQTLYKPVEAPRAAQKRLDTSRCDNCVWKSWADHTKCVMPSCLRQLGAVDGDRT